MGAIGGLCTWQNRRLDPAARSRLAAHLDCPGARSPQTLSDPDVGLIQRQFAASPSAKADGPVRCAATGCLAVADARIDNRDELVATLDLRHSRTGLTDTELILAAYHRWGATAAQQLIGDFAFAIWDPRDGRLFCGRDRMGVKPFYYFQKNDRFAFASSPKALLSLPEASPRINEQRVLCFLLQILPEDTATFHEQIVRLPPGHTLSAGPQGVNLQQYWSPRQVETHRLASDEEYAARFRDLFTEAVRCRLDEGVAIGSALSGGLDSSSITCVAVDLLRRSGNTVLHAISAVFPSLPDQALARIDERACIGEVTRHCSPVAHQIQADQLDPFAALADDTRRAGQPSFGPNMYIHHGLYAAARRQGAATFLDGIDGDSVISYGFEWLPQLLLTGKWPRLLREIGGLKTVSNSRQHPIRLVWGYAVKPLLSAMRDRLQGMGLVSDTLVRERRSLLRRDSLARLPVDDLIDRHQRRLCLPIADAASHHRASLALPYLSHILETCAFAASGHAIEPRYPFLDHRLVEFCLSLPPEQKLSMGWSRVIQRRAMAGIVPDAVRTRISKADLSYGYYHGLKR